MKIGSFLFDRNVSPKIQIIFGGMYGENAADFSRRKNRFLANFATGVFNSSKI